MDRKEWNNLVEIYAPKFGSFLQSWQWGEFQRSLGRVVERVYASDKNGVALAQAIKMPLPFGKYYWYIPKGPIGSADIDHKIEVLREELPDAMFLRMEPTKDTGLLRIQDIQPSTTTALDLTLGKDILWERLKPKTRYNIGLAQRKGVVPKIVNIQRFGDFERLLDQTTARDKFSSYPHTYYKTLLETMRGDGAQAFLAVGFYNERVICANIMIDFGGVRTYLHGASSNLHRNVMAPYLLHWYLIEDAIVRGMHTFDFWGIAPSGASEKHPWQGITRYKMGFNGQVIEHPGTVDLQVEHFWYGFYRCIRGIRRMKV
jgi:lipid II:glycine glycyltransferase (peptidoglycan interpeptide bridge formation enzyme)